VKENEFVVLEGFFTKKKNLTKEVLGSGGFIDKIYQIFEEEIKPSLVDKFF
jgi:hypothetical protein